MRMRRVGSTVVMALGLVTAAIRANGADDTARFYGTWETTIQVNGQALTLVSLHDASGYHNHWHLPTGDVPAGEGAFSAADGRYTAAAPKPNDAGVYHFQSDDRVACTNAIGQHVVWTRTATLGSSAVGPAAGGTSHSGAVPAAPAYDPSLPPQTNAGIAAFNRKDYSGAWQNFMAAAQSGDAEAQAGVGAMLFKRLNPPGTGYYAQCEKWLLASANQGNTKGMGFLGQYYYASAVAIAGGINPGVNNTPIAPAERAQAEAKFTQARHWFERASAKGDLYAMGNFAAMLDAGIGGARDADRAAQLRAQIKAGPDSNFAKRVAANPGDSAMRAAWQAGHYADAVKQATELANKGDVQAEALLARAYYQGQGVATDDRAAFNWAQKAAASNDPDGLYFLGLCYQNSRGVGRNITKASELFDQAIAQGSTEARSARGGVETMLMHGGAPAGGPVFCNKGTADAVSGTGLCIGENGQYLDPGTGKPR